MKANILIDFNIFDILMGLNSFVQFVSFVLIPLQLILLILMSTGILRKQLNYVIKNIINLKMNLNGMDIRFFPLFALFSTYNIGKYYADIDSIQKTIVDNEGVDQSEYQKNLFLKWRNLLIHATNVILIL